MTPEEKWIAQGRTRDEYKSVRELVATLKADIDAHSRKLAEASEQLAQFIANPTNQPGPTGMTPAQYIEHFFKDLISLEISRKVRELGELAERMATLEKQIAEFD